ncbi:MAG TPA: 50S ribosomal protein L11 methyltransferase, partial [Dongiaceae bacterium]
MSDPSAFIRAETALSAPPLVPEIRLHLASEILPIWQATEADLARHGLPPPYWAFAWPGGQALTRHLLDHRELVAGRRVLDFAAGSGLSAIAAAMAGASTVAAADIDPFARAAIALNADTNGVDVALIEEDILLTPGDWPSDWDVILAGDVCYERPMAERVAAWFTELANA